MTPATTRASAQPTETQPTAAQPGQIPSTEARDAALRGPAVPDAGSVAADRPSVIRPVGLVVLLVALVASMLLSLAVGARAIPVPEVWRSLTDYGDTTEQMLVLTNRLPRTLAGLLVGMALGTAGALIQAVTRNPLADPGILGVNAGAGFAVVVGVAVFGAVGVGDYIWFAFGGAAVATGAVYLIGTGGRARPDPVRLTLAGVALAAVLSGLSTAVTLLDPEVFDRMRYWGAGSLINRDMTMVTTALPFILVGVVITVLLARSLNTIALGEDLAVSLGTHVNRTRVLAIVAVTLLCGAATAVAGPIGFIGLMVPHVARWVVGPHQSWIMLYTLLGAPVLLLCSDVLGRVVVAGEMQVGVVTAFLGAPVLIALIRRRRVSGL